MQALRRLLAVKPTDWLILLKALAVVGVMRLLLLVLPYRKIRPFLPSGETGASAPADVSRRVAWAVRNASRLVPGAACLPQALSAQYLLARKGFASRVRIGVRKGASEGFAAHAWLVSGEHVVIGGTRAELARFTPLADLGVAGS
jgi:hypothetical protein